jgi:hypothetical protein
MALALLQKNLLRYLGAPTAFSNTDKVGFGWQLALRVREPKLIYQGQTGLCGTSAAVVQLARDYPVLYADLAINLFRYGRGRYGNIVIEPSFKIRTSRNTERLAACDYVVLRSFRGSMAGVAALFGRGGGATSYMLTRQLRWAGYTEVEDHMAPNQARRRVLLDRMAEKLASGHSVIVFTVAQLWLDLSDNIPPVHSGKMGWVFGNHCMYVSKLSVLSRGSNTERVEIKYYTWGMSRRSIVDMDIFLSYFERFISYRDRL